MPADNSRYLVNAAQQRRTETLDRARRALHELGETGKRYTVTQIAAHAKVSRSWLYARPDLRDQIHRLTTAPDTAVLKTERREPASEASLRQRLTLAHARIRELDDDNRRLRSQIAHLHGQLRANRISTHITDAGHDADNLLTAPTGPTARNDLGNSKLE